jgi:magnesium transporter
MSDDTESLLDAVSHRDAEEAADLLEQETGAEAARVLCELNPLVAQRVLAEMGDDSRAAVIASASPDRAKQWLDNREHPDDSVGWLMEPPPAAFRPEATVADTIEALRHLAKTAFITYGYVVDDGGKLLGLLVMRDLLLAPPETRLEEVMLRDPFSLDPGLELTEAMRLVVHRHYPVYPVCDGAGRLLGQVRGQSLFEARAIEISAQAGQMVGVEGDERLSTPLGRSLRSRHPWLQLNLLTCFVAAAVVGLFQETLDRIVVLAAFIPVLSGQSGNTGSQALAVALRGMTLGDLGTGGERRLVVKEGLLGFLNGLLTGLSAGIGMCLYAHFQGQPDAHILGLVVWIAMTASCVVSGLAGALIPLALQRFGADPATAAGIFLTTATDVISVGAFLGLAAWMVG